MDISAQTAIKLSRLSLNYWYYLSKILFVDIDFFETVFPFCFLSAERSRHCLFQCYHVSVVNGNLPIILVCLFNLPLVDRSHSVGQVKWISLC